VVILLLGPEAGNIGAVWAIVERQGFRSIREEELRREPVPLADQIIEVRVELVFAVTRGGRTRVGAIRLRGWDQELTVGQLCFQQHKCGRVDRGNWLPTWEHRMKGSKQRLLRAIIGQTLFDQNIRREAAGRCSIALARALIGDEEERFLFLDWAAEC